MKFFSDLKQYILLRFQGHRPDLTYNLTESRITKLCNVYSYTETRRRLNYESWEPNTLKWSTTKIGVFKPEIQNWLNDHSYKIVEMNVKALPYDELMDMPDDYNCNHWAIRFTNAKSAALFKLTWA